MSDPARLPLWLRSIRQRPHTVILLCLLSATAVITSMLGPVMVRAVHQSTLTDAVDSAGLGGTTVSVSGDVAAGTPYDVIRGPATAGLEAGSGAAPGLWEDPEVVISSRTVIVWKARSDAVGRNAVVNAFDDDCSAFLITDGACPSAAGQVMISSADAERDKITLGTAISLSLARTALTRMTVVGIYDAGVSVRAGLVRPSTTEGVLAGVETDPVVLPTLQSAELPLPVTVTTRMAIRPDLSIDDVAVVQAAIEEIKLAVNAQDRLLELRTDLPDLPDLLARVNQQAGSAQVLIMVSAVQGLFLAIFALAVPG